MLSLRAFRPLVAALTVGVLSSAAAPVDAAESPLEPVDPWEGVAEPETAADSSPTSDAEPPAGAAARPASNEQRSPAVVATAASATAPDAAATTRDAAATTPDAAATTRDAAGAEAGPEPCAGPCWDEVFRRSSLGFSMGVGVAYLPEMLGLNEQIKQAGHEEMSALNSYFVMSVPMSIDHWMLLAQVRMTSVSSDDELTGLETLHGMISAGYSITSPEVLAIYPFVGLGIASASLTLGQTSPLGASFAQVAASSQGPLELDSLAFVGTTGMAAELLVARTEDHPTRGMFVGARVGVTACFTSSDWSLGTGLGRVTDGPAPPLGGYFAELNAGLRL